MPKAVLYNQKGEKKGDIELQESFFGVPMNESLIQRMVQYQSNNGRKPVAHVQSRADVRGGGRKPYKQKGTGNARQGSIRAPHYKGGGVVFGPKNVRNFVQLMPKKQRRAALFTALSSKAVDNKILVLDKYEGEIKTKDFAKMIEKLPLERDCLFIIPEKSELIEKSSANIPNVKTILVNYLNVLDVLKFENLVFLKSSLDKFEDTFTTKKD